MSIRALPIAKSPLIALVSVVLAGVVASGCTDGTPAIDDKLIGSLAASERGEIDRYQKRLEIVSRYREQVKKLLARTVSEVELVEKAKASADSLLTLRQARLEHAKTHVGANAQQTATEALAEAQTRVDVLTSAISHVLLRRDYIESYDIAAEDAVVLSKAELEKAKVSALASAKKIDEAKLKVSEFDVAAREAQTRYAGHIEAASKVRVALVKAKQAHDSARQQACTIAKGPSRDLLHCADKNGAPWARTLPEAETLDKLLRNALDGKGVSQTPDAGEVQPLTNDLDGRPAGASAPPATPPVDSAPETGDNGAPSGTTP